LDEGGSSVNIGEFKQRLSNLEDINRDLDTERAHAIARIILTAAITIGFIVVLLINLK
jgi:hypothetical protein